MNIPIESHTIIVTIGGEWDFTMRQASWEATTERYHQEINFVIDLAKVESVQDSGQHLLLMLKECADRERTKANIIHCNARLREELHELNLDQYFEFL